jgi:hypothetical protein
MVAAQIIKKILAYYGSRKFIILLQYPAAGHYTKPGKYIPRIHLIFIAIEAFNRSSFVSFGKTSSLCVYNVSLI